MKNITKMKQISQKSATKNEQKMINVSCGKFLDSANAISKLFNATSFSYKTKVGLELSRNAINEKVAELDKSKRDLLKQYAKTDEKGNLLTAVKIINGQQISEAIFETDEKRTKFEEEYNTIRNLEFLFLFEKIKVVPEQDSFSNFSAEEFGLLSWLIDFC